MHKKLAIITTHPIQYYAPVFQLLAKQLHIKVFYTWGEQSTQKYDKGFKQVIEWDLPLLEGYAYEFLENTAKEPGSHHFKGIVNPGLVKAVQAYKPDAILVYGWAWQSHLRAMRYFKGKIPVYFRGDSTLLNKVPSWKNALKGIFLKWVYRHVHTAFYVGAANKAYFKAYGLQENQLIFAPHAIDNDRFGKNRNDEAQAFRNKLGLAPGEILILFAGKLEPVKNPALLLAAFQELNIPRTHLLFVGNGQLEEKLKATIQNSQNTHFVNFQNQTQMPVVYQACDLFCLPSVSETWGLAVNEAMAATKPVLVSDRVGCAIDLVDETNGAIFKSGDLTDLKQKLIALTENPTVLEQMGGKSFEKIQNWSFQKQVKSIVEYVS